jgi:hypothetical protein
VYRPAARHVRVSKNKRAEYKSKETAHLESIDTAAKRGLANLKLLPAAPVPAAEQAVTELRGGMQKLRTDTSAAEKILRKANPKKAKKFDALQAKATKKAGTAPKTAHPGTAIGQSKLLARAAAPAPHCREVKHLTGGDIDLAEHN